MDHITDQSDAAISMIFTAHYRKRDRKANRSLFVVYVM